MSLRTLVVELITEVASDFTTVEISLKSFLTNSKTSVDWKEQKKLIFIINTKDLLS